MVWLVDKNGYSTKIKECPIFCPNILLMIKKKKGKKGIFSVKKKNKQLNLDAIKTNKNMKVNNRKLKPVAKQSMETFIIKLNEL